VYQKVPRLTYTLECIYLIKFGQHPLQNSPIVQRHIDPSAIVTAGTRAGSPVLEAYQEHSAIPAGSPPLCQSGDPLAAASSSGRRRSRKWANLVSTADAEV